MNEISVIINGVRYDEVPLGIPNIKYECKHCDLYKDDGTGDCLKLNRCPLHDGYVFKKSDRVEV